MLCSGHAARFVQACWSADFRHAYARACQTVAVLAPAPHLRQPIVSAGGKAIDQVAEELSKLALQQAEDRKQQAERDRWLELQLDALQAELNRASQTSQAEADIGKVCFLQMLFCPSCPHALMGCWLQDAVSTICRCKLQVAVHCKGLPAANTDQHVQLTAKVAGPHHQPSGLAAEQSFSAVQAYNKLARLATPTFLVAHDDQLLRLACQEVNAAFPSRAESGASLRRQSGSGGEPVHCLKMLSNTPE